MAEWNRKLRKSRRVTPDDAIVYHIAEDVIEFTNSVLADYGRIKPSNEGMVYWAGIKSENLVTVTMAIAPATISNFGMVKVPHLSNLNVILELSKNKLVHIAQVHSHPTEWVDHSPPDNTEAAFKTEGLLSLVIPWYGKKGMNDLLKCGIHRFQNSDFIRFSNKYIASHFKVIKSYSSLLIDQRHGPIK